MSLGCKPGDCSGSGSREVLEARDASGLEPRGASDGLFAFKQEENGGFRLISARKSRSFAPIRSAFKAFKLLEAWAGLAEKMDSALSVVEELGQQLEQVKGENVSHFVLTEHAGSLCES